MNQGAYIIAKKTLIISTSARRNSNSDILADAFMNGAKNAGNEVEKVSLAENSAHFFTLPTCFQLEHFVLRDLQTKGSRMLSVKSSQNA